MFILLPVVSKGRKSELVAPYTESTSCVLPDAAKHTHVLKQVVSVEVRVDML